MKILIIKLGYSELLVKEDSRVSSLGDVLRCTSILHILHKEKGFNGSITWVTDEKALPLLKGNKYIDRLMAFDLITSYQLQAEHFDLIINLEKISGVCLWINTLHVTKRCGFLFNFEKQVIDAYDAYGIHVLNYSSSDKKSGKYFEEYLFMLINGSYAPMFKWNGELPILGYKPKSNVTKFTIGLNNKVGNKWPTKVWGAYKWDRLESLFIIHDIPYSYQPQETTIESYIDWINSVDILITCDSLGLHIAHALGKKIVALFGPTSALEVYIKDGIKILPEGEFRCMPCFKNICENDKFCMNWISLNQVYNVVNELLTK